MIQNKTIAVVVPCFNEEQQISRVIENMPDFVDRIIIVDDKSIDKKTSIIKSFINNDDGSKQLKFSHKKIKENLFNQADIIVQKKNKDEIKSFPDFKIFNENNYNKIVLIEKNINSGNGHAISIGLKWCKDNQIDAVAIMDGDGQMDPEELNNIISPVLHEGIDYVKGNRLRHPSSWIVIPKIRFIGNSILSILTKISSGFWRVSDTQTGYVCFSKKALNSIKLYNIHNTYGWPNDILIKLNIARCIIKEIQIKPIYNLGEKSKMRIWKIIFPILH